MTLGRLIKALAGYVGARLIGATLGLITQLALARTLLPADMAIVLVAMSAAAFLALLLNGGEAQLASTHLPKLLAYRHTNLVSAFHASVLRNMAFVFAGLGVLFMALWLARWLSHDLALAFFFGLICAPVSGVARYNAIVANSLRWFPLSYVPDFIVRPGLFLLAVFAMIGLGVQHNLLAVLLAFGLTVWVTGLGQWMLMQGKGLRLSHWNAGRRVYGATLRRRSLALLLVSIASFAFADIVMLLAGFLLPREDAAVAGIAVRLAALAGFVLQAGQLFVLPDFAEAIGRRDMAKANAMLWKMNSVTLAVIVSALLVTLFLGGYILSFFGEHYAAGATVLSLFLAGQSIRALSGMNQSLLAIEGHQIKTALSCAMALAILVALAMALCPALGLTGLGLAVIGAEAVWLLGLAYQSNRLCGRRADILWLVRNT